MKRERSEEQCGVSRKKSRKNVASSERDHRVTELLKICLQKVCELQADLERDSEEENDAESAGYTVCALETMRFLASEGLTPDHPMVKGLRQKLLKR